MLQQAIIKQYNEVFKNLTYRQASEHTGIQMTRIFRIFNGAPMKLSEYEIFYRKIQDRGDMGGRLSELAREAEKYLSSRSIFELASEIERRVKLKVMMSTLEQSMQSIA